VAFFVEKQKPDLAFYAHFRIWSTWRVRAIWQRPIQTIGYSVRELFVGDETTIVAN